MNNYVSSSPKYTCFTYCCFNCECFTEQSVYFYLDKLAKTAPGPDGLPYWLLKIAASNN